jgi:hypothetical protein
VPLGEVGAQSLAGAVRQVRGQNGAAGHDGKPRRAA